MSFLESLKVVFLIAVLLGAGLTILYVMQNKLDDSQDTTQNNTGNTDAEDATNKDMADTVDIGEDDISKENEQDTVNSFAEMFTRLEEKGIDITKSVIVMIAVLLFIYLTIQLILAMGSPDSLQQTGMSLFK